MRAKGSRTATLAISLPGALPFYSAAARRKPLGIDISRPMGMGALIAHALLIHAHLEDTGRGGWVRATSPLYSDRTTPADGDDVFARFFQRPAWPAQVRPLGRWAGEYLINHQRPAHIGLDRAQHLFARLFQPGARLRDAIDQAFGAKRFDASIHFRGTDKFLESGRVTFAPMFDRIRAELGGLPSPDIFLATDDAAFEAALRREMPHANYWTYNLGTVPDGVPRHFSALSPSDKALEALVNIFMIARAPVCIRTSSYLSAVSALVDPALRTVTINRTITRDTPFPELELLAHEAGWS